MNIVEIDMAAKKNNRIYIPALIIFVIAIICFLLGTGCTLNDMIMATYNNDSTSLLLRDIDIDDKEVESIKTVSSDLEKSYDISQFCPA